MCRIVRVPVWDFDREVRMLPSWTFTQLDQPDWSEVKRLASRLGVDPIKAGETAAVCIHITGQNGDPDVKYDVMKLVHGVLDRLDEAEKKTHKPITHF